MAQAAASQPTTADNRMAVARAVSSWPSTDWLRGDWPLAISLAARDVRRTGALETTQQDGDYLAVAFPLAYLEQIARQAAEWSLPLELLYAVIRTETLFNPVAESPRAALGLFQFLPTTFHALNQQWKLVPAGDVRAAEAFLLTPDTNILLGARWFREKLLPSEQGDLLFALMAHNAGPGAVGRWKSMWTRFGRGDDYEFVVDTVPLAETRGFAQRALTALWIAGARIRDWAPVH
jgi:soluble lytic murein transglycosylase